MLFVGREYRDVVPDGAHAFGDGLVYLAGLPSGIWRKHRVGGADRVHQFGDGGRDVEQQVTFLATVVVVTNAPRDPGELTGPVFDHAEFGHQGSVSSDLVGDFVDVTVAVVERLTVVHGLPLDPDLA